MGAANTKSKRKAETATARKPMKRQSKIDRNPLFAEIANIDTIVYTHFAIATRFPGLLPKELLTTILLDMRIEALRDLPRLAPPNSTGFCVMGAGGVGKSCLVIQFVMNHFVWEYDPTIEDVHKKHVTVDDDVCLMDILDTAGTEEYSVMHYQYIQSREAFMIVYAITSRDSFNQVQEYVEKIFRVKDVDSFPLVIVGSRCDLEDDRQVTTQEGIELGRRYNCPFYEASAKTRANVEEAFYELVRAQRRFARPKVSCGRRRPPRGMCGVLAADLSDSCALPKMPSEVDYETVIASRDGCCHSIVEERYDVVWEQLMRLFPSELSAKEEWKAEICRPLSLEAMKRVTEISELDSQLAEAILQHKNSALTSS